MAAVLVERTAAHLQAVPSSLRQAISCSLAGVSMAAFGDVRQLHEKVQLLCFAVM